MWACVFIYLFIYFGGKDTGALAEQCDVSGLWICQVAVKDRTRERERYEEMKTEQSGERKGKIDCEREWGLQGCSPYVLEHHWMRMVEFSRSHLHQTQTGHDIKIWYVGENNYQFGKKKPFYGFHGRYYQMNQDPHTQTLKHTHSECSTHIQSLKIPLGARFIGVVIGFITPLHHSAALPFAMVDEPLRPLKHGRLRDWGWGKGGKEGGWCKSRCLRSLLLHLLHHQLMLSIHLFSHCWRSLTVLLHSLLNLASPATSPLSLSTKKSEQMDCHTL